MLNIANVCISCPELPEFRPTLKAWCNTCKEFTPQIVVNTVTCCAPCAAKTLQGSKYEEDHPE